ncbi:MAG: hypothetical protein HKN28_06110 [Alphaproteobacteria bacterium]|nr:hypothetical protein [Alphaproteobacteria bacterium]
MPPKINPLRLNKLQLRTLALAQVLANDAKSSQRDDVTGEVTLLSLPQPHGDHVHVGGFVVASRDASGFANPAVWTVLARKGLTRTDPMGVTLTVDGLNYDTGLSDRFAETSDH